MTGDAFCSAFIFTAAAALSCAAPAASTFSLPVRFEQNLGQAPPSVHYLARTAGLELEFLDNQIRLQSQLGGEALTVTFRGASRSAITLEDVLAAKVNYLKGTRRIMGVEMGGKVRYAGVYPGIDLVFYQNVFYPNNAQWEFDFELAPGSDPSRIDLAIAGAASLDLTAGGEVVSRLASGESVHWRKPVTYQVVNGSKTAIASAFALSGRDVRFRVGNWDRRSPLVIDPSIGFSTLIAGGGQQMARGIATDSSGNIYICGGTNSGDLPTSGGSYQASYHGSTDADLGDAFFAKFSSTGALTYLTYLGGPLDDTCTAIAVDASGNAYLTGLTGGNFPVAGNVSQTTYGGSGGNYFGYGGDAFVAKFSSSGSLVYSTYLGGRMDDVGAGITVDSSGNAYVVGATLSGDFPTQGGFQTHYGGSADAFLHGGYLTWNAGDAFVEKINSSGQFVAGTYLGGMLDEGAVTVALDSNGNVWTAGSTCSGNFPLANSFQSVIRGQSSNDMQAVANLCEGFFSELNSNLSQLLYSTFIGGNGDDLVSAIVPDSSGRIYLAGFTASTNFPVTVGAYQTTYSGPTTPTGLLALLGDAFVAKFDPSSNKLIYATYLGGSKDEGAGALAIDSSGNAFVAGLTKSTDLPVSSNALQPKQAGSGGVEQFGDGFIAELDATGSKLLYSSYLGGHAGDAIVGLTLANGTLYVTGGTASSNFPVSAGAPAYKGTMDMFVASITGLASGPAFGVSNVASYDSSAIAPGEVVAVFIDNMGPAALVTAVLDPKTGLVATTLAGTSVLFNNIPAPMVYTSAQQLAAIVPYELAGQSSAQIMVQYNNTQSSTITMPVLPAVPGLFSANQSGTGLGAFQNQDGSYNSQSNPAAAGTTVVLYGTGQGQTTPPGVDGALATTVFPVPTGTINVMFDGAPSPSIAFKGPIPEIAEGFWQINAQLPTGIAPGPHAVQVSVNGRNSQGSLMIYTK